MITAFVIAGFVVAFAGGWHVGFKHGAAEVAIVEADKQALIERYNKMIGRVRTDAAKVETTVQSDVKTAEDAAKKIV